MIIRTKEYASHSYFKAFLISLKESITFLFSFCMLSKQTSMNTLESNNLSMKPFLDTDENGYIKCISCNLCAQLCPQDALKIKTNLSSKKLVKGDKPSAFILDLLECSSCQMCIDVCPTQALKLYSVNPSTDDYQVDLIQIVEQ